MEFLVLVVLLGLIPAVIAKGKGHSFVLWWFYGAALFIVALPHSLLTKSDAEGLERAQLSNGRRKCPHCAEFIKVDANVCRYCGRDVAQTAVAPDPLPTQEAQGIARELLNRWNSLAGESRAKLARQLIARVRPGFSAITLGEIELKRLVSELAAGRCPLGEL